MLRPWGGKKEDMVVQQLRPGRGARIPHDHYYTVNNVSEFLAEAG